MNTVILTGNVCSMFNNNTNIRLTIADNYKDNTDYITVTLFNNQMEFARKYIKIGDHVAVQGRVSTFKNNMGKEVMGITANNISFEGYKNPNKQTTGESTNLSVDSISENDFVELGMTDTDIANIEDDLPF